MLSALAEGADTLFVEAALAKGIPVEVVLPFEGYIEDFSPGPPRERFTHLLGLASHVHRMPSMERSDAAYLAAGRWVVDHCDLLIAVWDEQPARGVGGTGDIVQYARSVGRPVTAVNLATRTTSGASSGGMGRIDPLKFEEYKFIAGSTQFLTERRQAAAQLYLTLNVGILAVLGALLQSTRIAGPFFLLPSIPLFIVGILVCRVWLRILTDYRALIGWRYEQLMEMEQSEALRGCHQVYVKEWRDFYQPRQIAGSLNFTSREVRLPRVLIGLYLTGIVLGVVLAVAGAFGSQLWPQRA